MKKLLAFFVVMLYVPMYAAISDRTVLAKHEEAVYFVEDTFTGKSGTVAQKREGSTIFMLVENRVITIITKNDGGRETLFDAHSEDTLLKMVFTRSVEELRNNDESFGTIAQIERSTHRILRTDPVLVKVQKVFQDITIYEYVTNDGDIYEIRVEVYKKGEGLPLEINIRKYQGDEKNLISEVVFIKQ